MTKLKDRIIKPGFDFRRIDQNEFMDIDYVVMGAAFEVQNQLGTLFSEFNFKTRLLDNLTRKFDSVNVEVPIIAQFRNFEKNYYADLVVNNSVIYELKVADGFTSQHKSQLLNYLYLTGLAHGKLINLATSRVDSEFVFTTLTLKERRQFSIDDSRFVIVDRRSAWLRNLIQQLLTHFGGFLDSTLSYEAVYHFAGGKEKVIVPVPVVSKGNVVGHQAAHLISPKIGFKLTSFGSHLEEYRSQLKKFLANTSLKNIHWFNLYRTEILMETIST